MGQRSTVLVLAPSGNGDDRALEIVACIAEAGGRAIVACEAGATGFSLAIARPTLPPVQELLSPLLYHLPAQLLVLHLADRAGGYPIPLRRLDDGRFIRAGNILTDPGRLA